MIAAACIYKWGSGEGKGEEKLALSLSFSVNSFCAGFSAFPLLPWDK